MGRQPSDIAQQVSPAVKGDGEATRAISEAIESRDPGRIKTVLKERAGVDVTDEEIATAVGDADEVVPYGT